MTTTQTPEFAGPIVSVGYDARALACVSPLFPEVFHFPLAGWPEVSREDGYASYALKLATAPGELLPPGAVARVAPGIEGADLRMAAVLLVVRASGGPNALTPDILARAEEIVPRLAAVTRVSERPWTVGSRLSGLCDADLDLPEVAALLYHPSTQACLALLTGQWAQFLLAILGDEAQVPPGIGAEAAREMLVERLPECRAASLTVPPEGHRAIGKHVALHGFADTRWSPVVVLDQGHEVHFHPGFLHTDLSVPLQGTLDALTPLARQLSERETAAGTLAAWRAVANPRCVFRNRNDVPPAMTADEVGTIVETFVADRVSA